MIELFNGMSQEMLVMPICFVTTRNYDNLNQKGPPALTFT